MFLLVFVLCSEQVMLLHALSSSSGILLADLQMLSQGIDQPIDMEDIASSELLGSTPKSGVISLDAEVLGQISLFQAKSAIFLRFFDH